MNKLLLAGGAIGMVVIILIGAWLVLPLFVDKTVSEDLPVMLEKIAEEEVDEIVEPLNADLKRGNFTGFDALHQASGEVKLIRIGEEYYIRFEDDFESTNGPDLFVHLGNDGKYDPEANLGRLKGNIGSQNYLVSDDVNPEQYDEVWIWCRAFSVPFGKAVLEDLS